jgi:DNA polymerase I-like protein with 3'-5' exonuclease and polymerase domains
VLIVRLSNCFISSSSFSQVSPWQREAAKGVALGTLYGMGPEALASRLKAAKQRAETAGVSAEAEAAPGDADMAADDDDDDASSASTLAVSPAEMQAARDLQQRFFASFPAVQAFLYQSVANVSRPHTCLTSHPICG